MANSQRQIEKKRKAREAKQRAWKASQHRSTYADLHSPMLPRTLAPMTVEATEDAILVRNMPGMPRMSVVIEHVAEPIMDLFGDSQEGMERAITWTVIGWNLTQVSMADCPEFAVLSKGLEDLDADMAKVWQATCALVAARKRQFYPNLNRMILDVKFTRETDGGIYFELTHCGTNGEI